MLEAASKGPDLDLKLNVLLKTLNVLKMFSFEKFSNFKSRKICSCIELNRTKLFGNASHFKSKMLTFCSDINVVDRTFE